MVKTKEELINMLKASIGDNLNDDNIALIENLTDTIDDLENRSNGDGIDWKAKCEEVEKTWKQKYIDRFTSSKDDDIEDDKPEPNEHKVKTFDELFETKE